MYCSVFKISEKPNFKVNQIFSIYMFTKSSVQNHINVIPGYASGTSTVLSSTSPLAPSLSE